MTGVADGLIIACEDVVESSPTPEYLEALERCLAFSVGQRLLAKRTSMVNAVCSDRIPNGVCGSQRPCGLINQGEYQ